jgi:protein TonB
MPAPPGTNAARAARFQGTIQAEGTVTVDGRVEHIKIVKAAGLGLDESVMQTMKTWKCKPAVGKDGKPIAVTVPFQFNFRL